MAEQNFKKAVRNPASSKQIQLRSKFNFEANPTISAPLRNVKRRCASMARLPGSKQQVAAGAGQIALMLSTCALRRRTC
jgi:hypothetical protein